MHSSRLFQMLSTLNEAEFKRFRDFLESPYHNQHLRLRKLAEIIGDYFPDLEHEAFHREKLFPKLFPGEDFEVQLLYNDFSYLVKLLEQFLVLEQFSADTFRQEMYLLTAYRERILAPFFERKRNKMEGSREKELRRDEAWFQERFEIAREGDYFFQLKKETGRKTDRSLQEKSEFLDKYYLSAKFKTACEMMNRKNVMGGEYDLSGLTSAMHYFEENRERFGQVPAIFLYYQILKTLLEPDSTDHFHTLIEGLETQSHHFEAEEARGLFQYAQNYCIRKLNQGDIEFLHILFGLYEKLLENELIYRNGVLSQWDYKNIVSVALRLEKYEWARNFIEKEKNRLEKGIRENAFAYNLAHLNYATGEYGKALKLLQQVEFTDVFYHLGTKSTLLKIYFELDEMEALFSHIATFKVYLTRNKQISPYQYTIHNNLLRLTKQLYRLRLRHLSSRMGLKTKVLQQFREKVKGIRQVANINWLLAQLDKLEEER